MLPLSACYAGLLDWENSAEDAKGCIGANKSFIKGYFRLATALKNMNQLDAARDALNRGIAQDPKSADLKQTLKDVEELIRADKVASLIAQAESQLKNQDYASAVKTADSALRMDAGNADANRIISVARPRFEAEEKVRKSGLSKVELLKEEGDASYKEAQFEKAIEKYTKCLDSLTDKTSALAIKCYSNRSACYKQLSNFDGTVSDCTAVLEVDPNNVKALIRRAQAFEAIERFRFALQDVRAVLSMGDMAGASNIQLANGMQHRLNRVVQQLKSGDS